MAARLADAHPFRAVAGDRQPVGERRFFVGRFHAGQVENFVVIRRVRGRGRFRLGRAIGPDCGRRAGQRRGAQGVAHFLFQRGAHLGVGQFLPVDHAEHEIDRLVIRREGHQYAAIENVRPALVDEFGLEADRRGIGDDLEIMVGQPRHERAGGHVIDIGDRSFDLAFLPQGGAEIHDRRVFETRAEIEQDAVGAEIVQFFRCEILDRGQGAVAQQRGPIIIGPHLHPPFVGHHHQRRVDRGVFAMVDVVPVVGDIESP